MARRSQSQPEYERGVVLHVVGGADLNAAGRSFVQLEEELSPIGDDALAALLRAESNIPLLKMLDWSTHAVLHVHLFATAQSLQLTKRLAAVIGLLDTPRSRRELVGHVHLLQATGNSGALDAAKQIAEVVLQVIDGQAGERGCQLVVGRAGAAPWLRSGLALRAAAAAAPDVRLFELDAPDGSPARCDPASAVLHETTAGTIVRQTAAMLAAERQPAPLAALLKRAIEQQPELGRDLEAARSLAQAAALLQQRPDKLDGALARTRCALKQSGATPREWVDELERRPYALLAAEALHVLSDGDGDLGVVLLDGLLPADVKDAHAHVGLRAARNRSRMLGDGPGVTVAQLRVIGEGFCASRGVDGGEDPWMAALLALGYGPPSADPVRDLLDRAGQALACSTAGADPGTLLVAVAGEATLTLGGSWLRDACGPSCTRQGLGACRPVGDCRLDLRAWGTALLDEPPDPQLVRSPMLEAQLQQLDHEIERFILLTTDQPSTTEQSFRRRDTYATGMVLKHVLGCIGDEHPLHLLRHARVDVRSLAVDLGRRAAVQAAVRSALDHYADEIELVEHVVMLDLGGHPDTRDALLLELLSRRPQRRVSTFRMSRRDAQNTTAGAQPVDVGAELHGVRQAAQLRSTLRAILDANAPDLAFRAAQSGSPGQRTIDLLNTAAQLQSAPADPDELLRSAAALCGEAIASAAQRLHAQLAPLPRVKLLLDEAIADLSLPHAPRWRAWLRLRTLAQPLATVIAQSMSADPQPHLQRFAETLWGAGTALPASWPSDCAWIGHSDVEKSRRAALAGGPAQAVALAGLLDCAARRCSECPMRKLPSTGVEAWCLLRPTKLTNAIAHEASARSPEPSLDSKLRSFGARTKGSIAQDVKVAIVAMAPVLSMHKLDIVRDLGRTAIAAIAPVYDIADAT